MTSPEITATPCIKLPRETVGGEFGIQEPPPHAMRVPTARTGGSCGTHTSTATFSVRERNA